MDKTPPREVKRIISMENLGESMIPKCCREGWKSCPHVVKKGKKTKTNIGL